ncbi:hypothetical protein T492DRAFT_855141, partial [Pavlovales sp. CCMP2436]
MAEGRKGSIGMRQSARPLHVRPAGWHAWYRDAAPAPQSRTRVEEAREANAQTCRTCTRKLEVLSTSKLAHLAYRFLPRGMTDASGAAVGFVPHQQTTAEHALLANSNAAPNFGLFGTGELCAGARTSPLAKLNTVKPIRGIVIGAFGEVSADTHSL